MVREWRQSFHSSSSLSLLRMFDFLSFSLLADWLAGWSVVVNEWMRRGTRGTSSISAPGSTYSKVKVFLQLSFVQKPTDIGLHEPEWNWRVAKLLLSGAIFDPSHKISRHDLFLLFDKIWYCRDVRMLQKVPWLKPFKSCCCCYFSFSEILLATHALVNTYIRRFIYSLLSNGDERVLVLDGWASLLFILSCLFNILFHFVPRFARMVLDCSR